MRFRSFLTSIAFFARNGSTSSDVCYWIGFLRLCDVGYDLVHALHDRMEFELGQLFILFVSTVPEIHWWVQSTILLSRFEHEHFLSCKLLLFNVAAVRCLIVGLFGIELVVDGSVWLATFDHGSTMVQKHDESNHSCIVGLYLTALDLKACLLYSWTCRSDRCTCLHHLCVVTTCWQIGNRSMMSCGTRQTPITFPRCFALER